MKAISLIFLSLIIFGCKSSYNESESNLKGTYYTVKPSTEEIFSIMYAKGYFNFTYTRPNDACLELKEDNVFTHHINYCKIGETSYDGKWSVKNNTLLIDYDDASKVDLKFTILSGRIYTIRDFKTTIDNKEEILKSLTLMERKK